MIGVGTAFRWSALGAVMSVAVLAAYQGRARAPGLVRQLFGGPQPVTARPGFGRRDAWLRAAGRAVRLPLQGR
jgi:hypothetical protein